MKFLTKALIAGLLALMTVSPVLADGEESGGFVTRTEEVCTTSYNEGTKCYDKEVVVREGTPSTDLTQYETGIAEVATIATVLFLGGLAAFILAQKQLKV